MGKATHPRRGSMQFWPHVRASRLYARIRSWTKTDQKKLLGFIGYKAGMTHILEEKIDPHSPTKKTYQKATAATIIECPPMLPLAIRFYKKTNSGMKVLADVAAPKLEKELSRKIELPKKKAEEPAEFDDVRLLAYTQPKKTGTPNKKPEIVELGIGGKTAQEKLEFAKSLLDKEIKITDIFKEGQLIDTKAVTKGKGFQGPVKIHGVKIRQHKSEKTKRGPGNLGNWNTQGKIMYRVPHARKLGMHQRTEYNKQVLKMGDNPEDVNAKGGFPRFGLLKNGYVLIKGSVAGATKRPIVLTEAMRAKTKPGEAKILYVSTESKQRR